MTAERKADGPVRRNRPGDHKNNVSDQGDDMGQQGSATGKAATTRMNANRRLDPARRDALATLAHFYLRHHRLDKAVTLLTAMHKLDPSDAQTTLSLAWAWLQRGNAEIALRLSATALGRDDRLGRAARLLQARALTRLGRHDEARRLLHSQRAADSAEVA